MVEISVNYGETRSKDFQSETHNCTITVFLTEDQLLERTVDEWYYFYDNKLVKIVDKMFRTEKKESKEIAYNNFVEEEVVAKLPPEINKSTLDFNKVHKIGSKPCSKCFGPITWEYRPGIAWPIHVDEMGKIIGNGTCPNYRGDS